MDVCEYNTLTHLLALASLVEWIFRVPQEVESIRKFGLAIGFESGRESSLRKGSTCDRSVGGVWGPSSA